MSHTRILAIVSLFLIACLDIHPARIALPSQDMLPTGLPFGMPTTINPTSATPNVPTSLSGPADGDACNAASQNVPDQALLDGVTALRLAVYGNAPRPSFYSTNTTQVVVSGMPSIFLTEAGAWTARAPIAGATFSVADLEGGGAFSINTWYYMYYYLNAGTVTKAISTTAPDTTLRYKNGTTTHVYVGAIRVNNLGEILPVHATRGSYRYIGGELVAGSTLSGAGVTDIALGAVVPPTSRQSLVRIIGWSTSNTTPTEIAFYPKSFTGPLIRPVHLNNKTYDGTGSAAVTSTTHRFFLATDSSQYVSFNAAPTTYVATLAIEGFEEE